MNSNTYNASPFSYDTENKVEHPERDVQYILPPKCKYTWYIEPSGETLVIMVLDREYRFGLTSFDVYRSGRSYRKIRSDCPYPYDAENVISQYASRKVRAHGVRIHCWINPEGLANVVVEEDCTLVCDSASTVYSSYYSRFAMSPEWTWGEVEKLST